MSTLFACIKNPEGCAVSTAEAVLSDVVRWPLVLLHSVTAHQYMPVVLSVGFPYYFLKAIPEMNMETWEFAKLYFIYGASTAIVFAALATSLTNTNALPNLQNTTRFGLQKL